MWQILREKPSASSTKSKTSASGCMRLYTRTRRTPGQINYTVWSDVFLCPECVGEVVFFDVAVDHDTGRVKYTFFCPSCNAQLQKNLLERKTEMVVDGSTGQVIARAVQTPVIINYSIPAGRFSKTPTGADISLLKHIELSF